MLMRRTLKDRKVVVGWKKKTCHSYTCMQVSSVKHHAEWQLALVVVMDNKIDMSLASYSTWLMVVKMEKMIAHLSWSMGFLVTNWVEMNRSNNLGMHMAAGFVAVAAVLIYVLP